MTKARQSKSVVDLIRRLAVVTVLGALPLMVLGLASGYLSDRLLAVTVPTFLFLTLTIWLVCWGWVLMSWNKG